MKKVILTLMMMLMLIASYGQEKNGSKIAGRITGRIMDSSTDIPIEYATVALYRTGNARPINGTISESTGDFTVTKVSAGNYYLIINYIGFRSDTLKNIIVDHKNETVDLKHIFLHKESISLQSVTVTKSANLVENKIDKIVYNADQDITSQTGVATDILKKVPQISVDVDGNVDLLGSTNILFLIDGKPSTIFGSNITDVLQSIPANQIKKIEVITSPGAKYDAQGTGGIINIILKHNRAKGTNGNISLTTGTIIQNGSVNINARKGKLGVNAFMNGNARLTTTTTNTSRRVSTDTATNTTAILQQDGKDDFNRHGFESGMAFDWNIDTSNIFSGALSYHDFGRMSNGFVDQLEQIQSVAGGAFSDTSSVNNTNSAFNEHSFDPSMDYRHVFKNNKDHNLDIGMDGSFARNTKPAGNDQYIQPLDSLIYGTRNNNSARENEYEMKIDYTQPLRTNVNFEMGGKLSGYDISSIANALVWTPSASSYLYDTTLSNDLDYHQRVYAGYAELNFPIGQKIEARIGGRYERTQVSAFYANSKQELQKDYKIFIPSIFLMKKIDEKQTFKLNFTIRINRPDYRDLNPFVNTSDPKNITRGNPDLKPEVWDRYEASYNYDLGKKGSFMVTLFYRQSNGDIQSFIVYYPSIQIGNISYSDVAVTTRENIGVEKNGGIDLFVDLNLSDKFNIRSNIIYFHRYTINKVDKGYNSTGNLFRSNINVSYKLPNNFAAEFFGRFKSRHHEAQGLHSSFTSYSIALRKLLWKKKGSIALSANNVFSKYIDLRTNVSGPGFEKSSLRKIPYRSVGINFTWKFGKKEQ